MIIDASVLVAIEMNEPERLAFPQAIQQAEKIRA